MKSKTIESKSYILQGRDPASVSGDSKVKAVVMTHASLNVIFGVARKLSRSHQ